ncbi:hypothetical protein ALC62_00716, partial [Cyphomyrmex costatus]
YYLVLPIVILGAEIYSQIIEQEIIKGKLNAPIAQRTIFGRACVCDLILTIRYSELDRLLRITATCQRAISKFLKKPSTFSLHSLNPNDLQKAKFFWICSILMSDCGTNFKGADIELQRLLSKAVEILDIEPSYKNRLTG